MAPMKRKSTSTAGAAKRNRQLITGVVDAIIESEAVTSDLRALLKNTLPTVFEANKEDRHSYETEVVNQAQQALTAVQGERQQAHKAALAKQNEMIAPKEEQGRSAAKQQAEAKLEAVKAKLEADKATRKACEKAVDDAEDALNDAKHDSDEALRHAKHDGDQALKAAHKEDQVADKELQNVVNKKTALSDVLANEFAMLKDGTAPDAKTSGKAVQKLLSVGKEYHLDTTLMYSLPLTAKKAVAHRTEFETMMFTNLKSLIDGVIGDLSQKIAEAEPVKAAKAQAVASAEAAKAHAVASAEAAKEAAVAGAQGALQTAKDQLKAAGDQLAATQDARHEASQELSKAAAHLRHIWDDMKTVCDKQDEAAEDLKNLKEKVWAAFEELKEKQPEPEPVEEPEPMEEEAAPAAAAAAVDAETAAWAQ